MYLNANTRRPGTNLYTLLTLNDSICKSMTGFIKKNHFVQAKFDQLEEIPRFFSGKKSNLQRYH